MKVDVSGKDCPIPLMELKKAIEKCVTGDMIEMKFTCPEAVETLPEYCSLNHHQIINFEQLGNDGWLIKIKK